MARTWSACLDGDDLVSSRFCAQANDSYANEKRYESKPDEKKREGGGDHGTVRIRQFRPSSRAKFLDGLERTRLSGVASRDIVRLTNLQIRIL
jgi:hypothetical protein